MSDENNRPSTEMEEVYKDFAVIHAGAERTLNLLRGLDEKLKKAIAATTPERGNGDRSYQFYGLRMNCLDCTAALLKQFDSEFGQDVLMRAEVAINEEMEDEESILEKYEANYQEEKAIADKEEVAITLNEKEIQGLLVRLYMKLGGPTLPSSIDLASELGPVLGYLLELAHKKQERARRRNDQLKGILRQIETTGLNLLSMYFATEELDEDGDFNEDRDTLIAAAREVLLSAIREINREQLPY